MLFIHLPYSKNLIHTPSAMALLGLNPYCSSIPHFVPVLTLLISILPYILPTTLNKLIPLELLPTYLSPFPLYNQGHYTCTTSLHRYYPISKITFNCLFSHSNIAIPAFFKHSTLNTSRLGALSDFISFTPSLTSSFCQLSKHWHLPITNYVYICFPDLFHIRYLLKITEYNHFCYFSVANKQTNYFSYAEFLWSE